MIYHGFYSFSPLFFFDFFNENNIKILNCYLRVFHPYFQRDTGVFYTYKKVGLETPFNTEKAVEIFIFGQKNKEKIKFCKPIQSRYLPKNINKENNHPRLKKIILLVVKKNFLHYKIQKFLFNYKRGNNIIKLKN